MDLLATEFSVPPEPQSNAIPNDEPLPVVAWQDDARGD